MRQARRRNILVRRPTLTVGDFDVVVQHDVCNDRLEFLYTPNERWDRGVARRKEPTITAICRPGVHAVSKSEIVEACSDSVVFGGTGFFCLPQLVKAEAIENVRVGIKL